MKRHIQKGLVAMYRYICLITMMEYVGQAIDFDERHRKHMNNSKNNIQYKIDQAIRQFGIENFHIEIIEYVLDAIADNREAFWIEELGTIYPNGYNVRPGGATYRGWNHTEETIEKISGENNHGYGKPRPQEVKDRISASLSGENATWFGKKGEDTWWFGKHQTEEHKQHIGEANRGEKSGMAKTTEEDVRAIRKDTRSSRIIGLDYGLSPSAIGHIKKRRSWKHIP